GVEREAATRISRNSARTLWSRRQERLGIAAGCHQAQRERLRRRPPTTRLPCDRVSETAQLSGSIPATLLRSRRSPQPCTRVLGQLRSNQSTHSARALQSRSPETRLGGVRTLPSRSRCREAAHSERRTRGGRPCRRSGHGAPRSTW